LTIHSVVFRRHEFPFTVNNKANHTLMEGNAMTGIMIVDTVIMNIQLFMCVNYGICTF